MASSWSKRRQSLYLTVGGIVAAIVLVFLYFTFFSATPTCFNGTQDGDEHGVDCGGSCALLCKDESSAPVVLWSRIFKTGNGLYTAAAYIQNKNIGAGAKSIDYSFQLFDSDNHLVIERTGTTDLAPVQTIPIVEPNISVGNLVPSRVLFSFSEEPVWRKTGALPALRVAGQSLASDASKLSIIVANDSITPAKKVTVAAVLFDVSGTARGASKSVVDIAKKSSTSVVFTWLGGVPNIVRAEVVVLPSF